MPRPRLLLSVAFFFAAVCASGSNAAQAALVQFEACGNASYSEGWTSHLGESLCINAMYRLPGAASTVAPDYSAFDLVGTIAATLNGGATWTGSSGAVLQWLTGSSTDLFVIDSAPGGITGPSLDGKPVASVFFAADVLAGVIADDAELTADLQQSHVQSMVLGIRGVSGNLLWAEELTSFSFAVQAAAVSEPAGLSFFLLGLVVCRRRFRAVLGAVKSHMVVVAVASVLAACQTTTPTGPQIPADQVSDPERSLTVVYVSAHNCHYCIDFALDEEPAWLASEERKRVNYRVVEADFYQNIGDEDAWPEDLIWVRDALELRTGVPRFILTKEREVLLNTTGVTSLRNILLPRLREELTRVR